MYLYSCELHTGHYSWKLKDIMYLFTSFIYLFINCLLSHDAQDSWIVYVPFPLLAYEWLHALSNMNIFHSVQGHPRCYTV